LEQKKGQKFIVDIVVHIQLLKRIICKQNNEVKNMKRGQLEAGGIAVGIGFILLFILIWAVWAISIVNYNEFAFEKEFGKLKPEVKEEGFRWIGFGEVIRLNNQVRSYEIVIDAASADFQDVQVVLNLNIQLEKEKAYEFLKTYRSEVEFNEYLNNKVEERVKTVLLKYNAEEILKKRLSIRDEMKVEVMELEELKFFNFNDLTLKNIDYSEKFNEVLELKARVLQEREVITRQNENLELIKKNMDLVDIDSYFKYQLIEKWDGKSNLIISQALLR